MSKAPPSAPTFSHAELGELGRIMEGVLSGFKAGDDPNKIVENVAKTQLDAELMKKIANGNPKTREMINQLKLLEAAQEKLLSKPAAHRT